MNAAQPETHLGKEYYASQLQPNRTLRMDGGGVCQLCARKALRRVEMHSPLWAAGPIMYGECCLPKAEAALRALVSGTPKKAAPRVFKTQASAVPRMAWMTAFAASVIAALAVGLERLLPAGRPF